MKSTLGFLCALLLFVVVVFGAISYQMRQTVFDPAFAAEQIERADPVRIVRSILVERLDANAAAVLAPVMDKTLEDQRPWLAGESRQAAASVQDYLRGDSERIQVHIDSEPVRKAFLANMEETLRNSTPELIRRLGADERAAFESAARQAANSAFDKIGSATLDTERLSPDRRGQLMALRQRLALFQRPLILVICAIVALVALAAAIGAIRQAALGILVAGVALLLPTLFAGSLVSLLPLPALDQVPGVIAAYLPTFMEGVMAPLTAVAIACFIVAVAMLVVSLVLPAGPGATGRSGFGSSGRRPSSRRA